MYPMTKISRYGCRCGSPKTLKSIELPVRAASEWLVVSAKYSFQSLGNEATSCLMSRCFMNDL